MASSPHAVADACHSESTSSKLTGRQKCPCLCNVDCTLVASIDLECSPKRHKKTIDPPHLPKSCNKTDPHTRYLSNRSLNSLLNRRQIIQMAKKRVLVGYGVDIDAVAGWLGSYKGEDSTSDISRGLLAGTIGTRRLLKLFEKYGIKASWFIPGHSLECVPLSTRAYGHA
jgi:hypothetical protein